MARVLGRKRDSSGRSNPSVNLTKLGESEQEQEQLREERKELIRVTIANHSFETLLQPIVDLQSGGAVGVEALARFPREPIRPPDVWFDEAAILGLGVELEMAALHVALLQLSRLPGGLYLSLNASVETIMSEDFQTSMEDVLLTDRFQLTEHREVHDYSLFEQAIRNLRSKGVRLAVDDAGSGYSSFRHILNLHPDIIKLDIGLIRGIDADLRGGSRLRSPGLRTQCIQCLHSRQGSKPRRVPDSSRPRLSLRPGLLSGSARSAPSARTSNFATPVAPRIARTGPISPARSDGHGFRNRFSRTPSESKERSPACTARQSRGSTRTEENHGLLGKTDPPDDAAVLALIGDIQNLERNDHRWPLQTAR